MAEAEGAGGRATGRQGETLGPARDAEGSPPEATSVEHHGPHVGARGLGAIAREYLPSGGDRAREQVGVDAARPLGSTHGAARIHDHYGAVGVEVLRQ